MQVLFYDIETAPNLSYVWGHYEQNVIAHEREWYVLCVGYKWEHELRTRCVSLVDFEKRYARDPEDDLEVVMAVWKLLDQADIVVAHNGDKFDNRKMNARFIKHGLGPPSPYKTVDTLKVARKHFMFNSNALGQLGDHLGLGGKEPTGGFETWAGCMRGDQKAWRKMIRYAKQDVNLLELVYQALRPWMTNHPNRGVYDPEAGCPTCGGKRLSRRGTRRTQTMSYVQMHCKDCGAYSRMRQADDAPRPEVVP
jgi:hypothetical protein